MIVANLQLDDDVALTYEAEAEARKLDLKAVLVDRLARAQALDPRHRYLILADNTLARAEQALGGMPAANAEDFLGKLNRLAKVKFGEHELELTPGQMEEIAWRATKQGRTVEQLLAETWRVFCADFFTLVVPAGAGKK